MTKKQTNAMSWKDLRTRLRFDLAFFHWLKKYLPRGLYGRAILILVVPVILAQAVATYIFYDRHWQTVTNRLAFALAGEISAIVTSLEESKDPQEKMAAIKDNIANNLRLTLQLTPVQEGGLKNFPARGDYQSLRGRMMLKALKEKLPTHPFALDLRHEHEWIAIHVLIYGGVLTVIAPESRIYSPTAMIFILWMLGSSILLSAIAILFLRNQIRPIRRLAEAADMIGKGLDTPSFRPEGAREVRQAAINLLVMRDRLKRQISQRTAMLNGVSHDLRTPLTRMKLQLEMMTETPDITALKGDVQDMKTMLDSYLAFARGDDAGDAETTDLEVLLNEVVAGARRSHQNILLHCDMEGHAVLRLRAGAIKRALNNLIINAARYGKEVWISTRRGQKFVDINIDDNGPGIPEAMREEVFKPFTRLEPSRNPETGGVGLGLSIARDIAQQHGGTIILEDSPHGGLRAVLRLPV